jgi:thiol-disulfide isomerase/thioredoxin
MSGVLVVIKAETCGHCQKLTPLLPDIFKAVKKEYPDINIQLIEMKSMFKQDFDSKKHPQGLVEYLKWYPMILLIPTSTWEKGGEMKKGVQIMNGKRNNRGDIEQSPNCNFMNKDSFVKWIKESMENEDYAKELSKKSSSTKDTIPESKLQTPLTLSPAPTVSAQETATKSNLLSPAKNSGLPVPGPGTGGPVKKSVQIITAQETKSFVNAGQCKINMIAKK